MAWNHPNEEKKVERKGGGGQRNVHLKGLLAGAIVVIGALIAAWWMMSEEKSAGETPAPQPERRIKSVKPEKRVATPRPAVPRPAVEKPKPKDVVVSATTNKAGVVVETVRTADGKIVEKVHPPKSLFSNASDQMIALALSVKPGQSMAPLPSLSGIEKDFLQSLLEPIKINDDDSPEDREIKLAVKEARAYIAAEIKNGRTVQECLNEHREQMEKIADCHQMAVMEIQKMRENGASDEEVGEFRARINECFRDKDMPELPEPRGRPHKEQ